MYGLIATILVLIAIGAWTLVIKLNGSLVKNISKNLNNTIKTFNESEHNLYETRKMNEIQKNSIVVA